MSSYYDAEGKRVIDLIRGLGCDFPAGNIIKYVFRAGRKPGVPVSTDYDKALRYLDFMHEPMVHIFFEDDLKAYCRAFKLDTDMSDALTEWVKSSGKNADPLAQMLKQGI